MEGQHDRKKAVQLFSKSAAQTYDTRFKKIQAIIDNLHLLIRIVLLDLPKDARILCVGVGTGTEIIELAEDHPDWTFTGIEPSKDMLEVCRKKLVAHGLLERTHLFDGFIEEFSDNKKYDAVLCLLVTQFVKDRKKRQDMFNTMADFLNPNGVLINTELSADMSSKWVDDLITVWKAMNKLTGAPAEKIEEMMEVTKQHVAIEPPENIEQYLRNSGLGTPIQFFQSLLIRGWFSRKMG